MHVYWRRKLLWESKSRDKLNQQESERSFGAKFLGSGDSDNRTRFYTGLPNHVTFLWLVNVCLPILPSSHFLSTGLLIILVKLKLNLRMEDIALRFGISKSRVSKSFKEGFTKLSTHLRFLVRWPDKEEILRKLPRVFKHGVYSKSRVIIDCTGFVIERAGNLALHATTWSPYKHHNTIKVLLGNTLNGGISFVSRAFGGRVSDKVITQR